jgi:hypothetical protein
MLTAKQVGVVLNMSKRQVLRLPIPRSRFGRRSIRFREEDVYAYIDATRE